jgi:hypothetical protein
MRNSFLLCILAVVGSGCALEVAGDTEVDQEDVELATSSQGLTGITEIATVTDKSAVGPAVSYDGSFAYLTSKQSGSNCGLIEKISLSTGAKTTLVAASSGSCNRKGESVPFEGRLYYEDHTREDLRRVSLSSPFTDEKIADLKGSEAANGMSSSAHFRNVMVNDADGPLAYNTERDVVFRMLGGPVPDLELELTWYEPDSESYLKQHPDEGFYKLMNYTAFVDLAISQNRIQNVAINHTKVFFTIKDPLNPDTLWMGSKVDPDDQKVIARDVQLFSEHGVAVDNSNVYAGEWVGDRESKIVRITNLSATTPTTTVEARGIDQRYLFLTSTKLFWLESKRVGLDGWEHHLMRATR